jgi:hypothetical protein
LLTTIATDPSTSDRKHQTYFRGQRRLLAAGRPSAAEGSWLWFSAALTGRPISKRDDPHWRDVPGPIPAGVRRGSQLTAQARFPGACVRPAAAHRANLRFGEPYVATLKALRRRVSGLPQAGAGDVWPVVSALTCRDAKRMRGNKRSLASSANARSVAMLGSRVTSGAVPLSSQRHHRGCA